MDFSAKYSRRARLRRLLAPIEQCVSFARRERGNLGMMLEA
jgi:hypothetical protein